MVLDVSKKYVLSHEIRFRRQAQRCISYKVDDFFKAPENLTILHPREVICYAHRDNTPYGA